MAEVPKVGNCHESKAIMISDESYFLN